MDLVVYKIYYIIQHYKLVTHVVWKWYFCVVSCIQIDWLLHLDDIYIIKGTKYELSSIQSGGALKIQQIDSSSDTGVYTCIVGNRAGEEARRDIELSVNSKSR